MDLTIGEDMRVRVQSIEEGDVLSLVLDIDTPWGPIRNTTSLRAPTLRSIILTMRSKFGTMAHDFVVNRPHPLIRGR